MKQKYFKIDKFTHFQSKSGLFIPFVNDNNLCLYLMNENKIIRKTNKIRTFEISSEFRYVGHTENNIYLYSNGYIVK